MLRNHKALKRQFIDHKGDCILFITGVFGILCIEVH